jgi:hypothetical protein
MYGTLGLFLEPKRDISERDERAERYKRVIPTYYERLRDVTYFTVRGSTYAYQALP